MLFADHEYEETWEVVETNADLGYERLSCFAHSLELVIADEFKHSRVMSSPLAKVCFSTSLIVSVTFLLSYLTHMAAFNDQNVNLN